MSSHETDLVQRTKKTSSDARHCIVEMQKLQRLAGDSCLEKLIYANIWQVLSLYIYVQPLLCHPESVTKHLNQRENECKLQTGKMRGGLTAMHCRFRTAYNQPERKVLRITQPTSRQREFSFPQSPVMLFLFPHIEKKRNRCKRTHSVHCIYKHIYVQNTFIFILYNHPYIQYIHKDCTHTLYTHSHPQHYLTCMISQHLYFCLVV